MKKGLDGMKRVAIRMNELELDNKKRSSMLAK